MDVVGLTQVLEKTGLFKNDQIKEVLEKRRQDGSSVVQVAAEMGIAREEEVLEKIGQVLAVPYVKAGEAVITDEVLGKLPPKAIFQYNVIPLTLENNALRVAVNDPFVVGLTDALKLASGLRIKLALSTLNELDKAAKKFYGVGADTLERMKRDGRVDVGDSEDLSRLDLSEMDQEASVVKFVNQIIWEAHQDRATDIHLEPMERELRIRYRVDGALYEAPVPAQLKSFQSAIISRIKVMSNMDIAEKRLPQDGRISLRIKGEEIDVRVSTMPTVYGESVSMRLLMRSSGLLGMDKLGLSDKDREQMVRLINRPHGILLVTGPTGSGKSTSLYAWLHTINSIDKRIITTEDPIEYEMPGVNQVQIKPEIGLTFAVGLRHILRQDPDVIMVGEIRDKETAEIAIRAALTGHLVFSTLHTNDAAGAVTRLLDMGIEPFLVSSSVEGLVAQRLVRRLCNHCKRPWPVDQTLLVEAGFDLARLKEGTIYEPVGCEICRQTGYKGRTAIYEILAINDDIRQLIVARASSNDIKSEANRQGMTTLREDGWTKVLAGTTTVEEVVSATEEDEGVDEAEVTK